MEPQPLRGRQRNTRFAAVCRFKSAVRVVDERRTNSKSRRMKTIRFLTVFLTSVSHSPPCPFLPPKRGGGGVAAEEKERDRKRKSGSEEWGVENGRGDRERERERAREERRLHADAPASRGLALPRWR
eukprot:9494695-Pyramimonas_sp.AAC.1